jgi:acyl dehydratase
MTQVTNIPYDNLEVGQQASLERTVEERDIQLFAAVSGDNNPVHLDAAFAAETMFKERIAHGMFSGALISAAIACRLPGPGTIYLGQQLKFTRPVKLGDTLTVQLEVLEKLPKGRVRPRAPGHPRVQPEPGAGGGWRGRSAGAARRADPDYAGDAEGYGWLT